SSEGRATMGDEQTPANAAGEASRGGDDTEGAERQVGFAGEYLSGPEVRTALLRGETFELRPVQYTVVDGRAIFEGDIVVGSDEDLQRQTRQLQEEAAERARGVGTDASPGDSVDPARPGGPIL